MIRCPQRREDRARACLTRLDRTETIQRPSRLKYPSQRQFSNCRCEASGGQEKANRKEDPQKTQAPELIHRMGFELALAAKNAVGLLTLAPKGAIRVTARDGGISLAGKAEDRSQRGAAEVVVRNLPGVRRVSNLIGIAEGTVCVSASLEQEHFISENQLRRGNCASGRYSVLCVFVRKAMLVKYSCAYIVMPGELGSLNELLEAATSVPQAILFRERWRQIRRLRAGPVAD